MNEIDTSAEQEQNQLEQAAEAKPEAEDKPEGEKPKGEEVKAEEGEKKEEPPKKEKTPEEKEIARLRRRVDNLTRRLYQSGANDQRLQSGSIERTNQDQQADSEELRLTRAELQKLVDQRANELAPKIKQQSDEAESRRKVVEKLSESWGQEKFDQLASDLDDAFGGLADRSGRPKPATDAIFEADDPAALIEYLADPENSDEAEALSRMSPVQAGRAVAKLEAKVAAKRAEQKAVDKPKRSNAPAPVESAKSGGVANGMPDPSNTKAWIAWRNQQEGSR